MPHEFALKWGLSVCGDHEMTLQYACGARRRSFTPSSAALALFLSRHPTVARYLSPFLSISPFFSVTHTHTHRERLRLSLSFVGYPLSRRVVAVGVGWIIIHSLALSPSLSLSLSISLAPPSPLGLQPPSISVSLSLARTHFLSALPSRSRDSSLWLPSNRDFPSPHRRPT